MARRRRNAYREANPTDSEAHPIDDEVDRRLRHATLRKRILAAQGRVVAALGGQRHLYLHLEELVGDRHIDREEAMFNLGSSMGWSRDAPMPWRARSGARVRVVARWRRGCCSSPSTPVPSSPAPSPRFSKWPGRWRSDRENRRYSRDVARGSPDDANG